MKTRAPSSQGGFTLVEVMIALAILGTAAVVVLERRTEIVREASRSRDRRILYVAASLKIAELELDKSLRLGLGGTFSGDFGEQNAEHAGFTWEALVIRQPVDLSEPGRLPEPGKKPKELLRLTLLVRAPSLQEPVILEAQFAIEEPKPIDAEAAPPPLPTGRNP